MTKFDRKSAERLARETRRSEQQITPTFRPRQRRQKPVRPGKGGGEIIWAISTEEIPRAVLRNRPGDCVVTAVEVEAYALIPRETDENEPPDAGQPGQYTLEAILDGEEPKKYVVFNPSPSEAVPANEWFGFLPTSASLQAITIWGY